MVAVNNGFQWPVTVYYEDTDAGGVVYHSQYLNYCERARTEWLRALNIEQTKLLAEQDLIFVVHSLQASYHQPAKLDDALIVQSKILNMTAASLVFEQKILRDKTLLFTAQVKVACVNASKQRAAKIPNSLSALFQTTLSTDVNHE